MESRTRHQRGQAVIELTLTASIVLLCTFITFAFWKHFSSALRETYKSNVQSANTTGRNEIDAMKQYVFSTQEKLSENLIAAQLNEGWVVIEALSKPHLVFFQNGQRRRVFYRESGKTFKGVELCWENCAIN